MFGGFDADGFEPGGDPVGAVQQVRSPPRVGPYIRRVEPMAVQHVVNPVVDGHRAAVRSGRLVGHGQRVGELVLLEGELADLVVEVPHGGDEATSGVMGDQIAQRRRPTGIA